MARPKGSKNKEKVVGGPGAVPPAAKGHNSTMTDDQLQSLTRQHMLRYNQLLNAEKEAKAARMNFAKVIKSDLGDKGLENIKLLQKLETPEGEKEIKADLERRAMVARWAGLQIGTQGSLFDDDRRALTERAYEDGKRIGMKGGDCVPPYGAETEAGQEWIKGWHEAQAIQAQAIKATKKDNAPEVIKTTPETPTTGPDDFDNAANAGGGEAEGAKPEGGAPWPDDVQTGTAQTDGSGTTEL